MCDLYKQKIKIVLLFIIIVFSLRENICIGEFMLSPQSFNEDALNELYVKDSEFLSDYDSLTILNLFRSIKSKLVFKYSADSSLLWNLYSSKIINEAKLIERFNKISQKDSKSYRENAIEVVINALTSSEDGISENLVKEMFRFLKQAFKGQELSVRKVAAEASLKILDSDHLNKNQINSLVSDLLTNFKKTTKGKTTYDNSREWNKNVKKVYEELKIFKPNQKVGDEIVNQVSQQLNDFWGLNGAFKNIDILLSLDCSPSQLKILGKSIAKELKDDYTDSIKRDNWQSPYSGYSFHRDDNYNRKQVLKNKDTLKQILAKIKNISENSDLDEKINQLLVDSKQLEACFNVYYGLNIDKDESYGRRSFRNLKSDEILSSVNSLFGLSKKLDEIMEENRDQEGEYEHNDLVSELEDFVNEIFKGIVDEIPDYVEVEDFDAEKIYNSFLTAIQSSKRRICQDAIRGASSFLQSGHIKNKKHEEKLIEYLANSLDEDDEEIRKTSIHCLVHLMLNTDVISHKKHEDKLIEKLADSLGTIYYSVCQDKVRKISTLLSSDKIGNDHALILAKGVKKAFESVIYGNPGADLNSQFEFVALIGETLISNKVEQGFRESFLNEMCEVTKKYDRNWTLIEMFGNVLINSQGLEKKEVGKLKKKELEKIVDLFLEVLKKSSSINETIQKVLISKVLDNELTEKLVNGLVSDQKEVSYIFADLIASDACGKVGHDVKNISIHADEKSYQEKTIKNALRVYWRSYLRGSVEQENLSFIKSVLDQTDDSVEIKTLLDILTEWSQGSSGAQDILEGKIQQIASRRRKKNSDYVDITEKDLLCIDAISKSFRQQSLIPILVSEKFSQETRLKVLKILANCDYIDRSYLGRYETQEKSKCLKWITKVYDEFKVIPPNKLIDLLNNETLKLSSIKKKQKEINEILSKGDFQVLLKHLVKDEQLSLVYYCLNQSPFHYPGTVMLSYERFEQIIKRCVELFDNHHKGEVLDQFKEGLKKLGIGDDQAEQITEALLSGRAPLPKDSDYLDENGNFIPQRIVIKTSLNESSVIENYRTSFDSSIDHLVKIISIKQLMNMIEQNLNKSQIGKERKVSIEFELAEMKKDRRELIDMYEQLEKINDELFPPEHRRDSLETILNKKINKISRGQSLAAVHKVKGKKDSNQNNLLIRQLNLDQLIKNNDRILNEIGDRYSSVEDLMLDYLGELGEQSTVNDINWLDQLFKEYTGHVVGAMVNYKNVQKDMDEKDEIPSELYVEIIDERNIIEAIRYADGAHCCMTSDPNINKKYGKDIFIGRVPIYLSNATIFYIQVSTSSRSGKQIGWIKNICGLDENGKAMIFQELIYFHPRYQSSVVKNAVLDKIEEILFSIGIPMIAQGKGHVTENQMLSPESYEQQELKFTVLQCLDGSNVYNDAGIPTNEVVERDMYVKKAPEPSIELSDIDLGEGKEVLKSS